MNRALLSKRISSLLAEVSRLSNALCAMNTMDLQRYPENYELLSTDAALRAEQIACRMRHLVYGFTTVQKHEYLTSAANVLGITITAQPGLVEIRQLRRAAISWMHGCTDGRVHFLTLRRSERCRDQSGQAARYMAYFQLHSGIPRNERCRPQAAAHDGRGFTAGRG